jgi:hypothetical protein
LKAFELYVNTDKGPNVLKEILSIQKGMNRLRSDYSQLKDREINITPY